MEALAELKLPHSMTPRLSCRCGLTPDWTIIDKKVNPTNPYQNATFDFYLEVTTP